MPLSLQYRRNYIRYSVEFLCKQSLYDSRIFYDLLVKIQIFYGINQICQTPII